jgi:hypothetical protein
MSKHVGHLFYRGHIIVYSRSGYYLKIQEHPLTLLQFPLLEEAKRHVDTMLKEAERGDLDVVELRRSITHVVNDPALLARLTERDEEVARKVVQVAHLCGLLKEAASP